MLLTALLEHWKNEEESADFDSVQKIYMDKFMKMDFVDADGKQSRNLYSQIKQETNLLGRGITESMRLTQKLMVGIFRILGGIALSVSLFLLPVPNGQLAVLNSPFFMPVMLALMAGAAQLSAMLSAKSGSYWINYSSQGMLGNRIDRKSVV